MVMNPEERARELFKEAQEYYFRGMSGPAAECLRQLVDLNKGVGANIPEEMLMHSHRNLGVLYSWYFANHHLLAVEHFTEAVKLGAIRDSALCRQFGCSLYLVSRYEECIPWLREALTFDPDDTVARSFLAIALVEVSERNSDFRLLQSAREELAILVQKGGDELVGMVQYRIDHYFPHNRLRK
jgi:tetratricopeptide (TPR) repeat protein